MQGRTKEEEEEVFKPMECLILLDLEEKPRRSEEARVNGVPLC